MNLRKKIRKILLENDELKLSFLKLMDRFGIGHALEVSGGTDKFLEITGLQKVELVRQMIYELFDEVSFIEQSSYYNKPILRIYFDSDDNPANIESWFANQITNTISEYTSDNVIVCPYWKPDWDWRKKEADVYIDTILLKYDNLGNVINENYLIKNEDEKSKKKLLKEETEDQLEKFFIKMWDKQKEKQGVVFYDEKLIKMLGLEPENITHRIRKYYVDYMGGHEELERNVKNFFVGQTFSTNDLQKNDINVGGYDFVFKIVGVRFGQTKIPLGNGDLECYASFDIIEGNVTVFSGENFDLTDHDSISDELWWQLDQEIKDLIEDFMYKIINSFGIEVDHIYLEWG